MSFNTADYAAVDERLPLFWADCPRGRIATHLIVDDGTRIVMRADLYADIADPVPTTTGFAEEIRNSSMVNKTSALENCETSAVGRALANYQYQGAKKRASLEEVVKVYQQGGQLSPSGPTTSTNSDGPTDKQIETIKRKGWRGDMPTTKAEASALIGRLLAEPKPTSDEAPF